MRWETGRRSFRKRRGRLIDNMNERDSIFNNISKRITSDDKKDVSETELAKEAIDELDRTTLSAELQGRLDVVERMIKDEKYEEANAFLYRWRIQAEERIEKEIVVTKKILSL